MILVLTNFNMVKIDFFYQKKKLYIIRNRFCVKNILKYYKNKIYITCKSLRTVY